MSDSLLLFVALSLSVILHMSCRNSYEPLPPPYRNPCYGSAVGTDMTRLKTQTFCNYARARWGISGHCDTECLARR